jgi:hypothetical protein
MPTWAYVIIAVAVAVAVLLAAGALLLRRRSNRLRSTFESEYDRTLAKTGRRRRAEHELLDREKRRESLDIRPLSAASRERYAEEWRQTQADFVDSPEAAVREANTLVENVMSERGYPVTDFEEQAAVISVDHAGVVQNYRSAHEISVAAGEGEASTEDLRRAMRHYRSLFEDLLGETVGSADTRSAEPAVASGADEARR